MLSKSWFFIFMTCYLMHACNSRVVGRSTTDFPAKSQTGEVHEEKKLSVSMSQDEFDTRKLPEEEEETILEKSKGIKGEQSGLRDCRPCFLDKSLLEQHTTKTEGSGDRRLLFSDLDFMETDYQSPRRKSPIHN